MERKIALVTGASRGLGKDMALALATDGYDLIITYNANKDMAGETLEAVRGKGRTAEALQLDLGAPGSIEPFAASLKGLLQESFGGAHLDCLVNNAGIGATIPFANVTEDDFDRMMNIHFKGVYFLTQKLLEMMNDGGSIINLSSGTTRFCVPGYSVYASMKGGIETLTRYLAKELGARRIRVNVVAPGPIETDFNNAAIRNNPEMKSRLSGLTALGRVGNAEDIGGIVAFLASERGRWISGQRIEASGGINL